MVSCTCQGNREDVPRGLEEKLPLPLALLWTPTLHPRPTPGDGVG